MISNIYSSFILSLLSTIVFENDVQMQSEARFCETFQCISSSKYSVIVVKKKCSTALQMPLCPPKSSGSPDRKPHHSSELVEIFFSMKKPEDHRTRVPRWQTFDACSCSAKGTPQLVSKPRRWHFLCFCPKFQDFLYRYVFCHHHYVVRPTCTFFSCLL